MDGPGRQIFSIFGPEGPPARLTPSCSAQRTTFASSAPAADPAGDPYGGAAARGAGSTTVAEGREAVARVLRQQDDRLLVVVGPCSIHDLAPASSTPHGCTRSRASSRDDLLVVMRVYFEKPRTTVGWKGLINDPRPRRHASTSTTACAWRAACCSTSRRWAAGGTEFLDPITPQFIADLVAWGAIGARTTESQVHRELASGLSMPVGFKNGTDGNVQVAIDAIRLGRVTRTTSSPSPSRAGGDRRDARQPDCHVILRGGNDGAELRCRARRARGRGAREGGPAGAADGRLQPRQQQQGSSAAARGARDVAAQIARRHAGQSSA